MNRKFIRKTWKPTTLFERKKSSHSELGDIFPFPCCCTYKTLLASSGVRLALHSRIIIGSDWFWTGFGRRKRQQILSEDRKMEAVKQFQNQRRAAQAIDPLAVQLTRDLNLESSKVSSQTAKWEHEDLAKVSGISINWPNWYIRGLQIIYTNIHAFTHTHARTHTHLSLIHIWRCRRTG